MTAVGGPPAQTARGARELLARRLAAQWIEPARTPGSVDVVDVVRQLGAMQAQDFAQSCWALGSRAPGSTMADVDAAYDSGAIVRSWPLRGTLHVTTPDDLRLMLALTAAKTVRGMAARHRQLELDDDTFARAREIARVELAGGGAASRDELLAQLTAGGIEVGGQRGMHLIWWLAHDGLVCWGPRRGTQQALVLLDEWAPPGRELDLSTAAARAAALGELVLRYTVGRGAVTVDDFCWWSKLTKAEAAAGVDAARDQLATLDVDGTTVFAPLDGAPPTAPTGHHALPGFDEYLLGYRNRSPALPAQFAERIVPGGNGIFLPMLVSRGTIVGTWGRRVGARSVALTMTPFAPLSATAQRGLERDLRRYAAFLGLPATITTGDPS
ncbi:winged helix DNA-binding domain-containing protein [Herbiconiux sp. KACC 21604]|uniref:winged helix DNA-binding domain-containing protein n=1 Tax=unclassified Herbiconiux TaxID=2618217 RepID=UPI001491F38A|nr:winged helix DNA-binding domain-containing protein [Herbiconiux sp. SALV-R1]QJU52309.1 winged helix DNA-binding domain-containing protein [Herbiconiux sp. SALV-R1]WPO87157.1 winged helix DNA-binding domain-containing protein [Herbiconiux sp. KACC 21604]